MYALSIRNVAALRKPKIQGWLAQLSQDQLYEVGDRLQRLKPEVMRKQAASEGLMKTPSPWTVNEVQQLLRARA